MGRDEPRPRTVDLTIRHRRFRFWLNPLLFFAFGFLWLGVAGLVMSWIRGHFAIPVIVLSLVALVVSLAVAQGYLGRPVARVKLGEGMEVWPGPLRYRPADILEVAFGPDPAEDYHESPLPNELCEATIAACKGRPFRLIISVGEAARLREWALDKGVTVNDPGGRASTGGTR